MDFDTDSFKTLLLEALQEHHAIVIDSHADHHAWIQQRIEAEKERKEMFKSLRDAFIQWSVVGLLGYLSYWIQDHFKP